MYGTVRFRNHKRGHFTFERGTYSRSVLFASPRAILIAHTTSCLLLSAWLKLITCYHFMRTLDSAPPSWRLCSDDQTLGNTFKYALCSSTHPLTHLIPNRPLNSKSCRKPKHQSHFSASPLHHSLSVLTKSLFKWDYLCILHHIVPCYRITACTYPFSVIPLLYTAV